MSTYDQDYDILDSLKAEHQQLDNVLADVRGALSAENRSKNRVDDLVTEMCELLENHFSREENDGPLKRALHQEGNGATDSASLLAQHEALIEEAEKLRLLVHSGVESPAWWRRIESDFHKFASRLTNHENAENRALDVALSIRNNVRE